MSERFHISRLVPLVSLLLKHPSPQNQIWLSRLRENASKTAHGWMHAGSPGPFCAKLTEQAAVFAYRRWLLLPCSRAPARATVGAGRHSGARTRSARPALRGPGRASDSQPSGSGWMRTRAGHGRRRGLRRPRSPHAAVSAGTTARRGRGRLPDHPDSCAMWVVEADKVCVGALTRASAKKVKDHSPACAPCPRSTGRPWTQTGTTSSIGGPCACEAKPASVRSARGVRTGPWSGTHAHTVCVCLPRGGCQCSFFGRPQMRVWRNGMHLAPSANAHCSSRATRSRRATTTGSLVHPTHGTHLVTSHWRHCAHGAHLSPAPKEGPSQEHGALTNESHGGGRIRC